MTRKITTLEAQNGWTFDLDNFPAEEFEKLNDALRTTRVSEIAETMARIVVVSPWGDATDPATYRRRPIKDFLKLGEILTEALKEDTKK